MGVFHAAALFVCTVFSLRGGDVKKDNRILNFNTKKSCNRSNNKRNRTRSINASICSCDANHLKCRIKENTINAIKDNETESSSKLQENVKLTKQDTDDVSSQFDNSPAQKSKLYEEICSSTYFRIKHQTDVYLVTQNGDDSMQARYLYKEENRLGTFATYPTSAAKSAVVLAQSGFAYTGTGRDGDDRVTCVFCQAVRSSWRPEEDVQEIHRSLSPNCSLVSGQNSGNVPIVYSSTRSFQELLNAASSTRGRESTPNRPENCHTEHRENALGATNLTESENTQSSLQQVEHLSQGNQELQHSINSSPQSITNNNRTHEAGQAASLTGGSQADVNITPSSNGTSQREASPSATRNTTTNNSSTALNTNNSSTAPITSSNNSTNAHNNTSANGPTYSELGIVTDRPKRPEYALKSERLKTYSNWPRDHRLQPSELADAGFFYAGYGDCARCFYCGGGLRNWDDEDDVWVEHARWFSKCSFIRQRMGQVFVDTVQDLNKTLDKIPYEAVANKMGVAALSAYQLDIKEETLRKDPAVRAVAELGFPMNAVIEMAKIVKAEDSSLSADRLLARLKEERGDQVPAPRPQVNHIASNGVSNDSETMRRLKENNNVLRQQTTCKICMDREVDIVFLPCGHLVSCNECAVAMKDCPVCRAHVKGTVRAFMS
uniref:RING-type domain-containing protein n=1 Tax=Biomphalaria glabrata TaxID=6526 RepID=A0A2C9JNY1_BIOGL